MCVCVGCSVPGVREYLRLRPTDLHTVTWPAHPPAFESRFLTSTRQFMHLAWAVFKAVAMTPTVPLTEHGDVAATDGASDDSAGRGVEAPPMVDADVVDAVRRLAPMLSGLNLIQYYRQHPVESGRRIDVCSAHEDTGLLTFGVCGPDPGLVIYDRAARQFVRVEDLGRPGVDVFVFVGKKLPLFLTPSEGHELSLQPTPHAVLVPPGVARTSTVFLLDIAK